MLVSSLVREEDHAASLRCLRSLSPAGTVEQRQAHWSEAAASPKACWSIRSKLQAQGRTRDLALFDLAIDSKLRGCDVVRLRVEDVAPQGVTAARALVRQQKTGRPVRFEMTEHTREAV